MNNKGFTLVEVLAVVVILALVMGIGYSGITSTINSSKNKSETIFVEKLSSAIDEYIDLNGSKLGETTSVYSFKKCYLSNCDDEDAYEVNAVLLNGITINDLVVEKLLNEEDIVNPSNKKNCLDGKDPSIKIFRDDDYVYYYYVDLSGDNTSCDISDDNGIINTLPSSLLDNVKASGGI